MYHIQMIQSDGSCTMYPPNRVMSTSLCAVQAPLSVASSRLL